MANDAALDRMQKLAEYRTTCRFLKRSGKGAIVVGAFILGVGILGRMNFQQRPRDYAYLCLGAVELLIGFRNRFAPSASGVILDGLLLILFGLTNATLQVIDVLNGDVPSGMGIAFAVVFTIAGARRISRYNRVRDAFEEPPSEDQLAWFDEIIAEIQASNVDETPDMVAFTCGFKWKGRRFGENAIFVDKNDWENLIVDRHDFEYTDKGKALFGKNRLIKLRIGERNFNIAEISPEMLAVLKSWRSDDEPAQDDVDGPASADSNELQ